MLEVKFYDTVDDSLLKFAVIISKSDNKWVVCKHKEDEIMPDVSVSTSSSWSAIITCFPPYKYALNKSANSSLFRQ